MLFNKDDTEKTGVGPEDVVLDAKGTIYTGLEDGRIIRISDNGQIEDFCNTQGRPFGLEFDSKGNLIVADAEKGLLSVDKDGNITVLCNFHVYYVAICSR